MNYRHAYHAGNFADVVKHFALTLVLQKMQLKDTPFTVIDTHAGIGCYDLGSVEAEKTLEYAHGIEKLFHHQNCDPIFSSYLDIVRQLNPLGKLQVYPGSPMIAAQFLRPHDQMLLSELHPVDCETLKDTFYGHKQIKVFCQDFQISLKSFLPPLTRRGVVLIDPAFEKLDEFDRIINGLQHAFSRFAYGVFIIWYPIKHIANIKKLHDAVKELPCNSAWNVDFHLDTDAQTSALNGSGLLMINPPWQIREELEYALPLLLDYLECTSTGKIEFKTLV